MKKAFVVLVSVARRLHILAAMLVVFVALRPPTSFSQQAVDRKTEAQSSPLPIRTDAIVSSNGLIRAHEMKLLLLQRQQYVSNLVPILNGPYPADVKHDVAVLLGECRATEAVSSLIRNLDLDEHVGVYTAILGLDDDARNRPVAVALERIGMPAIPELLNKILHPDDARIAAKCVSICQAIEGREITRCRFQAMLDRETVPGNKERLESALRILNDLKAETR